MKIVERKRQRQLLAGSRGFTLRRGAPRCILSGSHARVFGDSPARQAGIERGDILIRFDGERTRGIDDLLRLLTEERIARDTPVVLLRDGEKRRLRVIPEEQEG